MLRTMAESCARLPAAITTDPAGIWYSPIRFSWISEYMLRCTSWLAPFSSSQNRQ